MSPLLPPMRAYCEGMVDLINAHAKALEATGRRIAAVGTTQWDAPTPCEGWSVRDVVNHIVSGNWWATELAAGGTIEGVGDRFDGDVLGDDPVAAYQESAEAVDRIWRRPHALEAMCAVSYGPVPGSVYLGHRFIDVFIHGWDVAAATGGHTKLEPELVTDCWEVVQPQAELFAGSGAFGIALEAPDDADPQTLLLMTLGRSPSG